MRLTSFQIGTLGFVVVSRPFAGRAALASLTPAERVVAGLALRGLTNRQIASARRTSERTVANQLRAVYEKLGVGSRRALAGLLAACPEPQRCLQEPECEPSAPSRY